MESMYNRYRAGGSHKKIHKSNYCFAPPHTSCKYWARNPNGVGDAKLRSNGPCGAMDLSGANL